MTVSKAKREANKKWDAENMTIVGCRVTKDKAKQFKEACLAAGTNPNAVLLACVNKYIDDHSTIPAGSVQAVPVGDIVSARAGGVTTSTSEE